VTVQREYVKILLFVLVLCLYLTGCLFNIDELPSTSNVTTSNDLDEISMVFIGADQRELKEVQNAINKITKEKINATVKLTSINWGAWSPQTTLMLAGKEKVDLMVTSNTLYQFTTLVSKEQLLPVDDLLRKYGQGIINALGSDFLYAAQVRGKTYGVASLRDMAVNYGVNFRKDLLVKHNIDPKGIKTFDDLENVYATIKVKEPDVTPLVPTLGGTTPFQMVYPGFFDLLGDSLGVLPWSSTELRVVNMYETQEYAELVKRARKWYEAGYISKDAPTTKEDAATLYKAGKAFSNMGNQKPGLENQHFRQTGVQMQSVALFPPVYTTGTVSSFMFSIPTNSQYPEKAMQLLNLLYTDSRMVNLFHYGIEGKHYVKVSDNIVDFPLDVSSTNSGYNLSQGWMFGNSFLAHIWKGNSPDLWEQTKQFNKSAEKSKAFGFVYDSEPVKSEVAAVLNVVNEYKMGLETGLVDPEKILPQFISQMKMAGIDKIIAVKQRQLNEWASSKK
jgi:putative aldouronate transport system substrate-binding protein